MDSNTLFLVNCDVIINHYMNDNEELHLNHIVEAKDENEAIHKLEAHYNYKDVAYCVTYSVSINYCHEVIR